MASEREIRRRQALREEDFERRAAEPSSPLQSSGGGGFVSGEGTFGDVAPPMPEDEPVNAEDLGGALEDPNDPYTIEVGPDMKPRRVPRAAPGPQSFGDFLEGTGTDADTLVKIVRQDRLARQADRVPTFGETAAANREQMAMQEAQAAAQPTPEEQVQQLTASIRLLVDVKTGEFEPVMPDQPDPPVGPRQVLLGINPAAPAEPNIKARGKGVTDMDISRMGDPKRQMKLQLRKGYQPPEQYAGIAEALGVQT